MTNNFLMLQAPGFIRGINPKLLSHCSRSRGNLQNPQERGFIRGVNLKSKI